MQAKWKQLRYTGRAELKRRCPFQSTSWYISVRARESYPNKFYYGDGEMGADDKLTKEVIATW